jgi:uncharacterized protein YceK
MKNKIITLAFCLLLVSCGSITKNKTSSEIESEKTTDTRTNTLITENTDSYTISPADLSQPITFGGKTYTNTVIKYEKANKVTEVDENKKVAEKVEIKETTKDKETNYTNLILIVCGMFIFMFIILLVFIHIQLKKNPLK